MTWRVTNLWPVIWMLGNYTSLHSVVLRCVDAQPLCAPLQHTGTSHRRIAHCFQTTQNNLHTFSSTMLASHSQLAAQPAPQKRVQTRKTLLATAQAQHQVERGLLLNVVVCERPAVLKLLPRENEALLVRRNALLVLDLGLDVVDGV